MLLILISWLTCQSIRDFESFFSTLGETRQIVVFENENLASEFELIVGMIGWERGNKIYGCLGLFHLRTKVSSRKTFSVLDFDPITPFWGFDWWLVTCSLVQIQSQQPAKKQIFDCRMKKPHLHFWRTFDQSVGRVRLMDSRFVYTFGLLKGPIRLKIPSRKNIRKHRRS